MFNEQAFRKELDPLVRDIPETMKLLKKIHDLLSRDNSDYLNTPDAKETTRILEIYVKHGGTFEKDNK